MHLHLDSMYDFKFPQHSKCYVHFDVILVLAVISNCYVSQET